MSVKGQPPFVALILIVTFGISLVAKPSLFRLGIWSFTGFASLVPLALAAVYWRGATRHGALASVRIAATVVTPVAAALTAATAWSSASQSLSRSVSRQVVVS